jgi:hypothetical protein
MKIDRNVVRLGVNVFKVDVVKEFDPTSDDEEYFLTLVSLTVKNVLRVYFDLRKFWKHCPDELLTFFIEKTNFTNDFTMGMRYNLAPEVRRKL